MSLIIPSDNESAISTDTNLIIVCYQNQNDLDVFLIQFGKIDKNDNRSFFWKSQNINLHF